MSPSGPRRCAYGIVEIALLRTMAGRTWEQISATIGSALSSSQRRFGLHARLLEEDPAYARRAAEIRAAALDACYPARDRAGGGGASG